MTPAEMEAWWQWFRGKLPAHDSNIWRVAYIAGILSFLAQHPTLWPPGHTPSPEWLEWLREASGALLAVGGKMASSLSTKPVQDKPSSGV